MPTDNPLRSADEATQGQARAEAWLTFQRSCRPCHGNLGAGDGPYSAAFALRATDLRRASRDVAKDSVRFERIRDGAASLAERPWESSMPAFGGELDDRQIWGLVLLLEDLGKTFSGLDPNASPADIYAARCAVCHGSTGAGDGPLAPELMPMPTSFVRGDYRFRSTEFGAAPIDTDIIGAIARGRGNTAMGRFLSMGGQQLEDVANHLRTFAPERFATPPPTMVGSPLPAGSIPELAARGRAVYEKAQCAECHGTNGRGNGSAASTLTDDSGRPSLATNLTKGWHFKGGTASGEIFRTLTTGMNGTPMQSFATSLSGDERWTLAHYLERGVTSRPRFSPTVHGGVILEDIPLDPTASFWRAIPPTLVPLGPQIEVPPYWTQPAIDAVNVTVAVNDRDLGILLVWDDPTQDAANAEPRATTVPAALTRQGAWRLPDRVAVQFPETTDAKGALPPMYLGNASRPVLRWSWSAERDARGEQSAVVERLAGPQQPPVTTNGSSPVHARAVYADGQWRVVLLSARPPKAQPSVAIALHAWDGARGEAGSWHSLSGWINVMLR